MPDPRSTADVATVALRPDLHADRAYDLLSKDYHGPGDEVREDLAIDQREAIAEALLAINANLALIAERLGRLDCSSGGEDRIADALEALAPRRSATTGRREVTRVDKRRAA